MLIYYMMVTRALPSAGRRRMAARRRCRSWGRKVGAASAWGMASDSGGGPAAQVESREEEGFYLFW
jgi:hypothetical protein